MDIFKEATIKDLLILAEMGENSKNDITDEPTLTRKLIGAKVLVDRWNNVVTDIIIHSSHKEKVIEELMKNIYFNTDSDPCIWGATIHFVEDIPGNKGLAISLGPDGELFGEVPSRAVSTFAM